MSTPHSVNIIVRLPMETYEGIQKMTEKNDLETLSDFVRTAIKKELSTVDVSKIHVSNVEFAHAVEQYEVEQTSELTAEIMANLPEIIDYFQTNIKNLKKRVKVLENSEPTIILNVKNECKGSGVSE